MLRNTSWCSMNLDEILSHQKKIRIQQSVEKTIRVKKIYPGLNLLFLYFVAYLSKKLKQAIFFMFLLFNL